MFPPPISMMRKAGGGLYTFSDSAANYSAGADLLATADWAAINVTSGTPQFVESSGDLSLTSSVAARHSIVHDQAIAADQSMRYTYRGGSANIFDLAPGVRMTASSGSYASGYYLRQSGTDCTLRKRDAAGTEFTLATYSGAGISVDTVLELRVTGTSPAALVAIIGGVTQTTVNDDGTTGGAILTSGKAGLWAYTPGGGTNHLIDNIEVAEI